MQACDQMSVFLTFCQFSKDEGRTSPQFSDTNLSTWKLLNLFNNLFPFAVITINYWNYQRMHTNGVGSRKVINVSCLINRYGPIDTFTHWLNMRSETNTKIDTDEMFSVCVWVESEPTVITRQASCSILRVLIITARFVSSRIIWQKPSTRCEDSVQSLQ